MRRFVRSWIAIVMMLPASPVWSVDYLRDIKPLLHEKCYSCHGVLKQESGLRLETRQEMIDAAVLVPGDADASEMLRRVTTDADDRMPPSDSGAALKPKQIELLRKWIASGAEAPDEELPPDPQQHWAFQRIERPPLPAVADGGPGDPRPHPIDAFLAAKRADLGLQVVPPTTRPLALRRLYLDLIGLPPTTEQLQDDRPWETIVDELLHSPHHGERWARHWMDIWRYSDWYGLGQQLRYSQKHLWHWRDWIVQSLNDDKGYDQMIVQMLAADEVAPSDPDTLRATGFLARNYYLFNRTTWLDSTIEHTGKAFIGLTLNCAKCHDHKYDPISQLDYYRFRAIFEPHQVRLDPVPGVTDLDAGGMPRVFDDHLDATTYLHIRGDENSPDTDSPLDPAVPQILSHFAPPIEPIELPRWAYAPGTRAYVHQDQLAFAQQQVDAAATELEKAKAALEQPAAESDAKAPNNPKAGKPKADKPNKDATTDEDRRHAAAVVEAKWTAAKANQARVAAVVAADPLWEQTDADPATVQAANERAVEAEIELLLAQAELETVLKAKEKGKNAAAEAKRGEAEQLQQQLDQGSARYTPLSVARKALETPEHTFETYGPTFPATSTGRRLALARWIVHRDNPLTARVAVNHVWLRHFGQPLVESVDDFGLRAQRPQHAELLDYLAAEFIESGYSFRHLHRLMVTADCYRLQSSTLAADPQTLAHDPDNVYLWRMNTRRMESQVVRDSLLHLAADLDLTLGGPSTTDNNSKRRSLYFVHSGDQQDKFLTMFDDADLLQCYRRTESIVPQQALALFNSELALQASQEIAGQLARHVSEPTFESFLEVAFTTLLARPPSDAERAECLRYRDQLEQFYESDSDGPNATRVWSRLVHALINHNDFISIR